MKPLIFSIITAIIWFIFPLFASGQSIRPSENSENEVLLYPNPVNENKFKIQSENLIISVEVLNVIGNSVYKFENTKNSKDDIAVILPDCEKGMYLIKITFVDQKVLIRKLLIK